jgi:prepilin-type N-terminal cleavage/methylation domain-containing protein
MRSIRDNKGFTLIELMIVVVIIGILAAIALPRFSNVSRNSKQAEAGPILRQICTLQGVRFEETGSFAGAIGDLAAQGWTTPNAKYFSFSAGTASNGSQATATAAPAGEGITAGLSTEVLNCATNTVTRTAPAT